MRPGDRVRMTAKAIKEGLDRSIHGKRITTGTFKQFDRTGKLLIVLRDGRKHTANYHPSFWEMDTESEVKR